MRLLLVDDEMLAIDGLKENLLSMPYSFEEIYTANSKSKAQVILEQHEIDMIFCDIEMPNGNGLELLSWVKERFPNVLSVILSCHDEFTFAQRAVQLSCFDYVLKPATPEVLYPVLERAFSTRKSQIQGERIRRIGEKFVGELSDHAIDREDTAQKVHQYIVNHVTEELSIEQLAQIFYLSPNYLTRCFKKKYGTTISEYIMNLRLTLAAEMLDKKEMTVTMVATKVGYPNYTYFTKIFKKKYGVSPIRYRSSKP